MNIPVPLANAGDQVPPGCGLPPSNVSKSNASLLEHKFAAPSVPALAGGVTVTVTDAVAFRHGGVPAKVYVYVPEGSTAGLKTPVPLANAGDQVPPGCAVEPSNKNKFCGLPLAHKEKAALLPAIGGCTTVIVVVTDKGWLQGGVPASVTLVSTITVVVVKLAEINAIPALLSVTAPFPPGVAV